MNRRLLAAVAVVLVAGLALPAAAPRSAPAPVSSIDPLLERGSELTYSLDFAEAIAVFQEAIAAQPNDARAYRDVATTTWLHILFDRGVVTVDDYLGHVTTGDQKLDQPPAADANRFQASIAKALALAEDGVRRSPKSAAAHYDVGAAVGITASYSATVEGRVYSAFQSARRAYNELELVLSLDPKRKDAGLVVGTYRYIVASLPLPVRLAAYVVGFGGGRERGLRMIEEAAAYPGDSQIDAKFALVLLYNRERRFAEALKVLKDLQARFPRNRLLWLEAGATALRAGRPAEAEAELDAGIDRLLRDARPRSFGEEALWYYKRGAARVLLGNLEGARADLGASLSAKGHTWVTARTHLEMGKLADLARNRSRAVSEYETAAQLGEKGGDQGCVEQARALIRTAYRKQ